MDIAKYLKRAKVIQAIGVLVWEEVKNILVLGRDLIKTTLIGIKGIYDSGVIAYNKAVELWNEADEE